MEALKSLISTVLLAQAVLVVGSPLDLAERAASPCPANQCFSTLRLRPSVAKIASSVCSQYIHYTPTVTVTRAAPATTIGTTMTSTAQTTPRVTYPTTDLIVVTSLTTSISTCSTTTSVAGGSAFPTYVNYVSLGSPAAGGGSAKEKRGGSVVLPAAMTSRCGSGVALTSKISSACSCLLGPVKTVTSRQTATVRSTTTVVVTSTAATATDTPTITTISTLQSTVQSCVTGTTTISSAITCGMPVSTYTTGSAVTCDAATPSNARFRIEGNPAEGTLFDGCIAAQPEDITTLSGGTHLCDGTNNGAHSTPGGTGTTAIDAAGRLRGFDFDGTWSNQFSDFFITRIGASDSTSNQFWGILRNLQYTPSGGCQEYSTPGELLWAYDAFNSNYFLALSSEYAVVRPGDTVSFTVYDGQYGGAIGGATIAGATSDNNGAVSFTAPMAEGCYLYKATRGDAMRSATFYLSVVSGL